MDRESKFSDLRDSSIARLMRWPFNRTRQDAERIADAEVATYEEASNRFKQMLRRIARKDE